MGNFHLLKNPRILVPQSSGPIDKTRFRKIVTDGTGETAVVIDSDIDVLLNQKSFVKNNPDFGLRYVRELSAVPGSNVPDLSGLSDDEILSTVKPRRLNSIGEILSWTYHLASRANDAKTELFNKRQNFAQNSYLRKQKEKKVEPPKSE